jgi:predicted Zn-dependent peptidase
MPTWGSEYSLRKINKEETKYFFRNYYVPSNIVISIVGDFKTKECIRIIKKSFHILPDQKKIRDYPDEPVLNGERRIKIRTNSSPYIFIGFYKPTYPNKEDYVLDLATQLLNEKLSFSLVSKRKMAAFVRVFTTPGIIFKNLLVIESIPISCSSSLLEKAIYEEIKKVRTNLNDSNLFAIVKERIKQKQKEILKSNYLLANNLSYYEAAYQNWKYIFEYANIIDQISLDDVQKCIFKYLHEDNRIVALIENLDN